jgi:hypothetical protein
VGASEYYALLQLHKQEASEGLGHITVYIAVAFGILGYLGAVPDLAWDVRISMAAGFLLFAVVHLGSSLSTHARHDAIHREIEAGIEAHPEFARTDAMRSQLRHQEGPSRGQVILTHLAFDAAFIAALLFLGGGLLT